MAMRRRQWQKLKWHAFSRALITVDPIAGPRDSCACGGSIGKQSSGGDHQASGGRHS